MSATDKYPLPVANRLLEIGLDDRWFDVEPRFHQFFLRERHILYVRHLDASRVEIALFDPQHKGTK